MRRVLELFNRLLFKNSCLSCKKESDEPLCKKCFTSLKFSSSIKNIGNVYYLWEYNENIRHLIHGVKFRNIKNGAAILEEITVNKIEFVIEKENIDFIMPVPIHKKREIERGFNHVELFLKKFEGKILKAERVKNTQHMYKYLNAEKRRGNIKGSFKIKDEFKISGKSILIFDDIITTGTTAFELTEVLKKSGAAKVTVMALAAGKYFKVISKYN